MPNLAADVGDQVINQPSGWLREMGCEEASRREDGGEGGIRTLDRGLAYTPLAGERLQPLGHLSEERVL